MDIERAEAICNVSAQIIDSARVEVKFLQAIDGSAITDFFGDVERPKLPAPRFEDLRLKQSNGRH